MTEFEYDDAYGTGNVTAEELWDSEKATSVPSLGSLSSASARVITRTYNSLGQVTEIDGDTVNTEFTSGTIPAARDPGRIRRWSIQRVVFRAVIGERDRPLWRHYDLFSIGK